MPKTEHVALAKWYKPFPNALMSRTPTDKPLEDEDVRNMRTQALEIQSALTKGKGKYKAGEVEGKLLKMVLALTTPHDQQRQGCRRSSRLAAKTQVSRAAAGTKRKCE